MGGVKGKALAWTLSSLPTKGPQNLGIFSKPVRNSGPNQWPASNRPIPGPASGGLGRAGRAGAGSARGSGLQAGPPSRGSNWSGRLGQVHSKGSASQAGVPRDPRAPSNSVWEHPQVRFRPGLGEALEAQPSRRAPAARASRGLPMSCGPTRVESGAVGTPRRVSGCCNPLAPLLFPLSFHPWLVSGKNKITFPFMGR